MTRADLLGLRMRLERLEGAPLRSAPDLSAGLFEQQRNALASDAPRLHLLCGRRAGKTAGFGTKASQLCLQHAGSHAIYVARSLRNASKVIFPELRRIRDAHGVSIEFRFGAQDVRAIFANGSEILFMGIKTVDRMEDLRGYGRGVHLLGIDEMGTYPIQWCETLVEEAAHPLTADCGGQIWLMGSPGPVLTGYWYDVTRDDAGHAWPVMHWTGLQNPHLQSGGLDERGINPAFEAWLADYRDARGIDETDAAYRREWLGEWVQDSEALVFNYDAQRNAIDSLPSLDSPIALVSG